MPTNRPMERASKTIDRIIYNRHMRCLACHNEIPDDSAFCPRCGEKQPLGLSDAECKYAAFISYRHLPRDQEVAKHVQKAIETFRMPKGMAAGVTSHSGDRAIGKCFRDEDELAASHSLPVRILDALEKSSSLIVVCSPDTKDSVWVQREIKAFIDFHGRERVFAVLASGSPDESIPGFLCENAQEELDIDKLENAAESPLAADFRSESADKAKDEALRIIAAVAGCDFDDLKQRNRARRRKRLVLLVSIALVAIVAMAIVAAKTIDSIAEAQVSESRKLASESEALLEQGDRYGAIAKALEALPKSSLPFERPLVDEARDALVDALELEVSEHLLWRPSYSIEFENKVQDFVTDPNHGWIAVMDESVCITTFDYASGKKLTSFTPLDLVQDDSSADIDSNPNFWKMIPAGEKLIVGECAGSCIIACYDAESGQKEWELLPCSMRAATTVFNGQAFYLCSIAGQEVLGGVFDTASKKPFASKVQEMPEAREAGRYFLPIAANEDGLMFLGIGNKVVEFDLNNKDDAIIGGAGDFPIWSINLAQNSIVVGSSPRINWEAKTSEDYVRKFRFESFDESLNSLWAYEGTWKQKIEGEGLDVRTTQDYPSVYGIARIERASVVCSVGDTLLLFDDENGELTYSEEFGSSIVSVDLFGMSDSSQYGDTIVVMCANGSVIFRAPFKGNDLNSKVFSFSFPGGVLDASVEWTGGNLLATALPFYDRQRVLVYHLDMRALDEETTDTQYSLDELISIAHETLAEGGYE